MPSTYTTNGGIELIATGEQSGTWGTTTNTNLQIVDRLTNGVGSIALSGTTHTLTTTDGILSDGQYAVLVFGGSPSGTNTVTISPNDAQHVYFVKNSSGQSVVLTQGSGGNVTVADGKSAIVYTDGAGATAAVVDITNTFSFQPLDADLTAIAALANTDGNFIVGNGSTWVAESGATARTSLGLTIGTDVQAYDAALQSISGLTTSADQMIYTTGSDTYATTSLTSAGRALLDDADASAQRTTLGLGSIATQAANNVSITGGSITGITDLAVADGGTGVSTVPTNGQLLIGNGTGYTVAALTAGTGISVTNGSGSISVAATNNGTVTSVGGTGTVNGLTLTGTVTSTGDLTLGGTLAISDADWSGTDLSVANGGTGASSFTANNVLLGNGTSAFQTVAPGTSGNVLTSNGTTWTSATPAAGYTNSDVDAHLNTSTASSGEVLSWTGSDYDWIAVSAGATDINGLSDGYSDGQSVGLGNSALQNDDGTSNYNTAVGVLALGSVVTGSNNTAVGAFALRNGASGGINSTAVGREALDNFVGNLGTAVGYQALTGASGGLFTGTANVGIGYQTGYDLTTGANNFLGGYRAGTNITTGSNNVALGNGALDAATTGGRNIAIGQDAMGLGVATSSTGDNIAIGYQAGYDLTSGQDNVLIGEQAGTNITTGSENVFIGELAGDQTTTGSNQIVIGSTADASSATVSNEITLGNSSITRFRVPGAGIDNTSAALSGTTPSVNVGARDTYTLTTSGNTTFTFTGVPSSGQVGTFSLIITAGGTHTLTWPASVDWAGGTAPDAPASGEVDIYTFMTVDGGTTWYGFLAGDAMA